ncbi:MAG TPA: response regulator [Dissulfurispiraceae bacterium]|nr:response regulator [Dissulfurispiraceae bacterium]
MEQSAGLVLLVDDEPQMRRFLRVTLQSQGYALIEAETGQEGLTQAATRNPDIILLDLGLPDIDGLDVVQRLREWSLIPIIVISAREQEQDKIRALDAGADDYLIKPFGAGELFARIRVALRHASFAQSGKAQSIFEADKLRVDLANRQVFLDGHEIHLTPLEYKLLNVLIKNAGKVVTHKHLMKEVWGAAYASQTQYLRVYMGMLRHKLEEDPARPRFFLNEPGVGYRFNVSGKE